MLQMVSWKEYFTVLGWGVLFYYGWFVMKYFRYGLPGKKDMVVKGKEVAVRNEDASGEAAVPVAKCGQTTN